MEVAKLRTQLFGKGGEVYEYPLNNKEFPARIIFAVIPNITASALGSTRDLIDAGKKLSVNNDQATAEKKEALSGPPRRSRTQAVKTFLKEQVLFMEVLVKKKHTMVT